MNSIVEPEGGPRYPFVPYVPLRVVEVTGAELKKPFEFKPCRNGPGELIIARSIGIIATTEAVDAAFLSEDSDNLFGVVTARAAIRSLQGQGLVRQVIGTQQGTRPGTKPRQYQRTPQFDVAVAATEDWQIEIELRTLQHTLFKDHPISRNQALRHLMETSGLRPELFT